MWNCFVCNKKVEDAWDEKKKKFYPGSNYWKGSPEVFKKIYCSPKCSLIDYKKEGN